jgi:hypothetical protein
MQSIRSRIEKLECGWSQAAEGGIHLFVLRAGMELALDGNRCVEILRQAGYLRSRPCMSVVRLLDVPWGLDADALEAYLHDHGGEICGARSHGGRPE